ncbi:MAG: transcription elongation factor GreA [Chloroflexi bacterium]|jgi:transcription elongation factor GreA|nr:transcription elongation factor GreA [Chloroflexota bacterium]
MSEEKVLLTSEGLEKLKTELEHLIETRRPEVIERIHRAKELGDTADNPEYEEAQNEQAFVEGRIIELERTVKNAEVMPVEKTRPSFVKFGSKVTVVNEDGEKRKYAIVGSPESSPSEGKISNESPVGRALLGKQVGDEVEVEVPKGLIKLKIASITKK